MEEGWGLRRAGEQDGSGLFGLRREGAMEEPGEDGGQCSGIDCGESGSICDCERTLDNPAKVERGHPGAWILAAGVEGAIGELAEVEGPVIDR